ncbi:MAG: bifunctional enoyl-CoA hydratase/phosphate acetyltransferase [Bacteroidales bacterium]|nr:bifunctional enoyl-CoA hydratase/phosphate acetyltransferase [Bacteroidales bacterium]
MIKTLNELLEIAKSKQTRRIAVAAAADMPVLLAIKEAQNAGIVIPILVGDEDTIKNMAVEISYDISEVEIIHESNPAKAARIAVQQVRNGNAQILMKGLVSSGDYLKAILDKETGLRSGDTLSHLAFFESPYYHKLIAVTDAAMNVEPEFNDKVAMVKNAITAFHKLGIKEPKIAIVGAVETVNYKMTPSVDAALMTMMSKRGQLKGCIIDGPLALDNAVSKEAAEHKGIDSPVAGDVDLIVTPDIYSGNVLYKSLNFLGGAAAAAVVMGATVPVVLTSRSDSDYSKLMSIALAAAMD